MATISSPVATGKAANIPAVTAGEAYSLMKTSLERFLALAETLEPEDWAKPTACTQWSVQDIVAHQAGGYASGTGYREMLRQYARIPRRAELPEDAINELQVRERAGRPPAELIEELRRVGPVACHKWAYQFRVGRWIAAPHPVGGLMTLHYLMWIIHSRDTWMHRLDICRATGRKFEQTAEHDGRIVALVMQDTDRCLRKKLGGQTVQVELTGTAGGVWAIGRGQPSATIRMDALDFNIFASGRITREEARTHAVVTGDPGPANIVFDHLLVLY